VPVALALAEATGAHGRDVIAACAKGFEMQGRILLAAQPKRGSLPFHTPGVIGVMGSTVAASHLIRLTAPQLTHALGIAASRCSGLPANTGSMVKCTHCGNAALSGIESALLSARGFTANPDILAAPHGYVATFFPARFDYDALFGFAHPYRCVDPGMAIKFYPSKYPTHFAITAALEARNSIGDPARIRAVRIVTPEIADANRPQPRSGLEGKFSFQYTAAAALLDGEVGINSFTDERRFRADMVELLGRISVAYDKGIAADTRTMHVALEVLLDDGATVHTICRKPPGTWGAPVNAEQHRAKIRDCLGVRMSPAQIERTLDLLDRLDQLTAEDVSRLTALLA
jgi:aconitate decarboxylase